MGGDFHRKAQCELYRTESILNLNGNYEWSSFCFEWFYLTGCRKVSQNHFFLPAPGSIGVCSYGFAELLPDNGCLRGAIVHRSIRHRSATLSAVRKRRAISCSTSGVATALNLLLVFVSVLSRCAIKGQPRAGHSHPSAFSAVVIDQHGGLLLLPRGA